MHTITGKQRRYLRSLAHPLKAVVQVGHRGVNDAVLAQVDAQLEIHELIKIKLGTECPSSPEEVKAALEQVDPERPEQQREVVQIIGRHWVVYRPRAKEPTIRLPAAKPGKTPPREP